MKPKKPANVHSQLNCEARMQYFVRFMVDEQEFELLAPSMVAAKQIVEALDQSTAREISVGVRLADGSAYSSNDV